MSKEQEPSAFVSQGKEKFPPLYFDNKDVANFSDDIKWPSDVLMARFALYADFLAQDDNMPRAVETANRITEHILFELQYREGIYLLDKPNEQGE